MANETISGGQTNNMFFSNWVGSSILDEARPHNVSAVLFNHEGRHPGLVHHFPVQDDPGAAASNQAEGTSFANTAFTTSSPTATARLNGVVTTVTDVLSSIAIVDAVSHFAQVMGRSVAEEREVTCGAVYANSTGAWAAATLAGFYDAMADLEAVDAVGNFVAVIKPSVAATLRTDVQTSTGAFQGGPAVNNADAVQSHPNGYLGNISTVPVFMTSATASSCMFVHGVSHGIYEIWDSNTEAHRDVFQPGTQLAATSLYGVATIRAAWSSKI